MSQRVHSFIHVPLCSRDTKEICIRLLNIIDFKCRMNRTKLYFEIKPYRFWKEIKSFLSCLDSLTVLKMMEKHNCAHIHIHICNIYINMQLHAYFLLNVRTELKERELWVILIESENLHPRRCSKAVWKCSWVVGDCSCAGWLDQMTSRGVFLSQPSYDSEILWVLQPGITTANNNNTTKPYSGEIQGKNKILFPP